MMMVGEKETACGPFLALKHEVWGKKRCLCLYFRMAEQHFICLDASAQTPTSGADAANCSHARSAGQELAYAPLLADNDTTKPGRTEVNPGFVKNRAVSHATFSSV